MKSIPEDSTIEIWINTVDPATGAPVAPSTAFDSSDFAIHKDGSATEKATTNGITVTSPFDSKVGLHLVQIDTSNDTGDSGFWTSGGRYQVRLSTSKTVGGVSIDGRFVPDGSFGIEVAAVDAVKIGGQAVELSSDNRLRVDAAEWDDTPIATTNPLDAIATHLTDVKGTGFVKDTHSLKDITTDIANVQTAVNSIEGGGGSGARTITVTVNDGTNPLESAKVRFTKGAESRLLSTNSSGVAGPFGLDDGTWTVVITLGTAYTFTPTTLVVDGNKTPTYSMTQVTTTPPSDPSLCVVTIPIYDQYGVAAVGEPVEVQFIRFTASSNLPVLTLSQPETSDANGIVEVELYRNAKYRVTYGSDTTARRIEFTVPDQDAYTVS